MPSAGYELRRRVGVEGELWTFCLKLQVVPELNERLDDWAGLHFLATITIWPPSLSRRTQRRSSDISGRYRSVKAALAAHGYAGGWREMPRVGTWGDFKKELADPAHVRQEVKVLEKMSRAPELILTGRS
jgi:hypothetical protein